ncbi:MAG: hypothetical protein N3E51_01135 [Candidatus Micrarchaeota archaeon]|nr:hypothetical protein [Candidatus Micrarchaeota archaeon]
MSMSHTAERPADELRARRTIGGAKGQAAVEVLSYASFFLLGFVVATAVFFQMQSIEISRAEHSFAQEIAYELADHIHTAFVAGPGFVQNVTLPSDILGKPYRISISRKPSTMALVPETGFVYVEWMGPSQNSSFSAPTITSSYSLVSYSGFIETNAETGFIEINPAGYPGGRPTIRMENMNGTIRISKG